MATPVSGVSQLNTLRSDRLRTAVIGILVIVIALIAFAWTRPLTLLRGAGRFTLWRDGIHSEYVEVGPYMVHYYVGGNGPPVVFVHGLGADALNWIKPMITLKRLHYRVYALDLLGHGDSAKPDIAYSIEQQSELLRQFLAGQGIRSADLIAVSMGGWVVLNLAAEHPEAVRRLVVADAAGLYFENKITPELFLPRNPAELQAFWAVLSPRPLPLTGPLGSDFLRGLPRREWIIRRMFASFETRHDLLDGRLQNIGAPVLLLWGKQEKLIPLEVGEEMKREMPQSSLLICPDSGHLAVFECWDRFRPEIANFLSAPQPPAALVQEIPAER